MFQNAIRVVSTTLATPTSGSEKNVASLARFHPRWSKFGIIHPGLAALQPGTASSRALPVKRREVSLRGNAPRLAA